MFGVISDTHLHKWSVFSDTLPTGVNNRLQHILDETWRAAQTVKDNGGSALIHCGDMFHVRGSVSPSVLNPTSTLYRKISVELGIDVIALAGNHDLEGNESCALGNAAEALMGAGVKVVSEPYFHEPLKLLLIPYVHSINKLREVIQSYDEDRSEVTLCIHAPLNEVIAGIPDNGLSAKELQALGFKAVFCGHYHNHKVFDGNVCSVGALTHQTFSDIDATAGFLLVDGDEITHYPSNAPRFVDFSADWDEEELVERVTGNFVRARLEDATNAEVKEVRDYLKKLGAAGIQIVHVPKSAVTREGVSSIKAGSSIRVSIAEWCKSRGLSDEVRDEAQSIMDKVEEKAL